jgi:hypothetical protein
MVNNSFNSEEGRNIFEVLKRTQDIKDLDMNDEQIKKLRTIATKEKWS